MTLRRHFAPLIFAVLIARLLRCCRAEQCGREQWPHQPFATWSCQVPARVIEAPACDHFAFAFDPRQLAIAGPRPVPLPAAVLAAVAALDRQPICSVHPGHPAVCMRRFCYPCWTREGHCDLRLCPRPLYSLMHTDLWFCLCPFRGVQYSAVLRLCEPVSSAC